MIEITALEALVLVQEGATYQPLIMLTDAYGEDYPCTQLAIALRENGEDFIEANATVLKQPPPAISATKFILTLGLKFTDQGKQCQNMARYHLYEREISASFNGAWELRLHSAESLVRDYAAPENRTYTASTPLETALTQIIREAIPDAQITVGQTGIRFLQDSEEYTWEAYAQAWGAIQEICDLADSYTCFNDGNQFRIQKIPEIPAENPDCICDYRYITAIQLRQSRENYYNRVHTIYTQEPVASAIASVADPNPPKTYTERISRKGTYLQALGRAKSMLARKRQEHTRITVSIARLPIGIRPYDTATVIYNKTIYKGVITAIEHNLKSCETIIELRAIQKD